jgi:hypothetical protein
MARKERVVSSRIKSRKVLGSANPIAKGFRDTKSGCADSFGGIIFGFILFFVAFWPAKCAVTGVEEISRIIEDLPLQTSSEVAGASGLVKIHGQPSDFEGIDLEIDDPERDYHDEIDVFWYHTVLKEWTQHTEPRTHTETKIEDGQEVEYEVEEQVEVEDWEVMEDYSEISDFYLDDIEISSDGAELILTDTENYSSMGREEIGEEWLEVDYIPEDDIGDLVVIGEINGDRISSGHPFIITDVSDSQLVERKKSAEKGTRTGLTIFSIILFFIAFNLIIGPLLFLLRFVPVVGPGIRFVIGIASLILAIVIVLMFQFILRYWWLLIILAIVIVGVVLMTMKKHQAELDKEDDGNAA